MRPAPGGQAAVAVAIALPACAVAGALATAGAAVPLFGTGAALLVACWLAARAGPVLVGILVLGAMNALPLLDVGARADVFVVALAGVLAATLVTGEMSSLSRRRVRASIAWGLALIGWWLLTWERSVFAGEVTPLNAFLYGRDFLFFAVLLPLLVATLRRRDIEPLLITLAAGAVLAALGHIAIVATGGPVSALAHVGEIRVTSGVPRIYSAANDLVITLLPIALGAALLSRTPRVRVAGAVAATIAFAAVAFLQVRAVYGGFALALIGVTALTASRPTAIGAGLRASAATLVVALAAMTAVVTYARPGTFSQSPVTDVAVRAVSGFGAVQRDTDSAAYRRQLAGSLLRRLGTSWPAGLGFLHPADRYFAGLPQGAIRNTDVGVTNGLMTMGAVGTALLYMPMVAVLGLLLSRLVGRPRPGVEPWLLYGLAVWLATVVLSSLTLVTLFSTSGLVLTATLLAVALVVT